MKWILYYFLPFVLSAQVFSQDVPYARSVIDTLCSPGMHGRGYVNKGQEIAAEFIAGEFLKDSLLFFNNNYFQKFSLSLCTLPGAIELKTGRRKLKPAVDFLVSPASASVKGKFKVLTLDSLLFSDKKALKKFLEKDYSKRFLFIDKNGFKDSKRKKIIDSIIEYNLFQAKGIIVPSEKLSWGVEESMEPLSWSFIEIKNSALPPKVRKIKVNIEQEIKNDYPMINVIGYLKGSIQPDSFIVFTAHYDHLGQMGRDVYFPGANDNASGTAMMLDLARHYSINNPEYSIAFIAVTGEELGLLGSLNYVKNPLFPLAQIKFLINLDMEGTGDDGIKVVNGTIFKKEFNSLVKINDENQYLKMISPRGEAAISDHYPFYAKGVKSFYIYTLGGISEYHNIYDRPETLPLTKYEELYNLIKDFIQEISK